MSDWPDNFDFDTDEVCTNSFKPFILKEMAHIRAYDDERPEDITYIFHQHATRVAKDVRKTLLHMGFSQTVANNIYWATLPHDIGKRLLPVDMWDSEEKPSGSIKKVRRTHTLLGVQIVDETFPNVEHPFKDLMKDIMANHHEQMDGNGTHGIPGDHLSEPVKLASLVEAYDGYRIWRPHFEDRDISPPGVLKRMREEKGSDIYDMEYFEAFADMKMEEHRKLQAFQEPEEKKA